MSHDDTVAVWNSAKTSKLVVWCRWPQNAFKIQVSLMTLQGMVFPWVLLRFEWLLAEMNDFMWTWHDLTTPPSRCAWWCYWTSVSLNLLDRTRTTDWFYRMDTSRDGKISRAELKKGLKEMGCNLNASDLKAVSRRHWFSCCLFKLSLCICVGLSCPGPAIPWQRWLW